MGLGAWPAALKLRLRPTGSVRGVDASTEMIEVAQRQALKAGVGVDFQVVAEEIPFPDETFDLIVSQLAISPPAE